MKANKINTNAPFWEQIRDDQNTMYVDGAQVPRAYYNLLMSIYAVRLYSKGIRPNRHWKIGQVKQYFGVSGNAETVKEALEFIKYSLTNTDEQ